MKKITLSLLLTVISIASFAANTWYTTGLDSDWDAAKSWSTDPTLIVQSGVPAAGDDIVVRHPLTMVLEATYQHTGALTIETEGILEILSFEGGTEYIFSGKDFTNEGILMTNVPMVVRSQNQIATSTFFMGEASQVLLGSNLSFLGKVDAHLTNGGCGTMIIQGALSVQGTGVHFYGTGGWVAEGGYRVYDQGNVEIDDSAQRDLLMASFMEAGLSLFSELSMCALNQRGLEGTWEPSYDFEVETEERNNVLGMFPNPQTNGTMLNISGEGFEAEESLSIEIRTMMGQQILSQLTVADENGEVHLSTDWNLEPGQYFVTVKGASHLATQRMVRQ